MSPSSTVAVYGLGIIGSRCADNLVEKGYTVHTWNRTAKPREDSCPDPASAAEGADFLSFYLKDGNALREVFNSLRENLKPEQIVMNHSTVDLESTQWLAAQCAEIGCRFLDAPFTGSKEAAAQGALVYYVGGELEVLENARAVLDVTSKEIKHLGPVGSATVVKIGTNLISASTVQALAEALAITQAHGIAAEVFSDAVASNASGSVLAAMKLPNMAAGNYETHFSMENMLKDSRFALELAASAKLNTPGIRSTSEAMAEQCKKGNAHLDFSALYKSYQADGHVE